MDQRTLKGRRELNDFIDDLPKPNLSKAADILKPVRNQSESARKHRADDDRHSEACADYYRLRRSDKLKAGLEMMVEKELRSEYLSMRTRLSSLWWRRHGSPTAKLRGMQGEGYSVPEKWRKAYVWHSEEHAQAMASCIKEAK